MEPLRPLRADIAGARIMVARLRIPPSRRIQSYPQLSFPVRPVASHHSCPGLPYPIIPGPTYAKQDVGQAAHAPPQRRDHGGPVPRVAGNLG